MKARNSLVKVESSTVLKGNQLLALTSKTLAPYYSELRTWWNNCKDDWKYDLIYLLTGQDKFVDANGQGKLFSKYSQVKDSQEWDRFFDEKGKLLCDPEDYELECIILKRNIIIETHENLIPLSRFVNLVTIEGSDINLGLKSLVGIEDVISLREISLRFSKISDLEPLRKLVNLERLDLHDSDINSLEPLSKLQQLRELNISSALHLKDLTTIAHLNGLINLNCSSLGNGEGMIDFSPVGDLHNLKELFCIDNNIESLDFLKDLKNLEWLNLENTYYVNPDLPPLSNLRNLSHLRISCTNVEDISPLSDLIVLEYLWVDNTKISEAQIISLSKFNPNCAIIVEDLTTVDGTSIFYKEGVKRHEELDVGKGIFQ